MAHQLAAQSASVEIDRIHLSRSLQAEPQPVYPTLRYATKATWLTFAFAALSAWPSLTQAQARYDFILVDSLNSNPLAGETRLASINDQGIACGVTTIDNVIGYPAIVWREAFGHTRIPIADPQDINTGGLVAGNTGIYDFPTDHTITPPILPGTYFGPFLSGVNDSGVAVGSIATCSCSDSGGVLRAPYIWDAINGARLLSIPNAKGLKRINNAGVSIGWLNGWVLDDAFFVDLNTTAVVYLADVFPAGVGSGPVRATDINDSGEIVGSRAGAFPVSRYGYVYRPESGVEILPFPGAGYQQYVAPTAINNAGTIVGTISTVSASQHIFVYTTADGLRDLNLGTLIAGMPAGYRLYAATSINNHGWIVGYGTTAAGKTTGFILKARIPPCPADFNGSGGAPDDADVAAFFDAWNNGDASADFNASGGTPDEADVAYFFERWNAGC